MVDKPNDQSTDSMNVTTLERPLNSLKGKVVAFWNARSIVVNFNLFKHDFEKSNLLSIGVSETWLSKNIPDCHIELDGFTLCALIELIIREVEDYYAMLIRIMILNRSKTTVIARHQT